MFVEWREAAEVGIDSMLLATIHPTESAAFGFKPL